MSLDALTKSQADDRSSALQPMKRKRSYAWLLPVGLVCGFVVILALLFGKRLMPAIAVKTAPVVTIRAGEELSAEISSASNKGAVQLTGKGELLFQASGWVEPDPYTVYVPTLVNGVIDRVLVLEGQEVKKGQLLATLVDDDAKLDLNSAKQKYDAFQKKIHAHCTEFGVIDAEITAANGKILAVKAALNEARDNVARLTKLKKGAVSEQLIVKARLAVEMQMAKLAEAEAEIPKLEARKVTLTAQKENMESVLQELAVARDRAQLALDRTQIKSSMDGVVLSLHAAPGKKRMLDMDSPTSAVIVELYNPKKLQARIDVPLNEAAALSAGQTVELVSDLLPNKIFSGVVTRISGQADLQRNTLQAKVAISNPDPRLRPDMLVRAKFFSTGKANDASQNGNTATSNNRLALYVLESALVSDTQVWVVSTEMTAEMRSITLGKSSKDGHRLVLTGLRSGESVILPPHDQLKAGARIKISN